MASNLDLLSAGFSAILGVDLNNEHVQEPPREISVLDLFKQTYVMRPITVDDEGDHLFISTLTGKKFTIPYSPMCTIEHVKAMIESRDAVPIDAQRLIHNSQQLENDDNTLSDYGIHSGATIYMNLRLVGGGLSPYKIAKDELAPSFDYDFSNMADDGHKYMRGGFEYKRPYGWKRIAIKVVGKYESDAWLGPNGIRTAQAANEWPVSYHGTYFSNANSILKKGFKPGHRDMYGKGIYSSPSLEMVERHYAQQFTHKGKTYKIVFQNRVNPDQQNGRLKVIPASMTGVGADYWVTPNQDPRRDVHDVRPYGILIKEVK